MLTPYENSKSTGILFLPHEKIIKYGEKALPNGIALAVHAIGDKAVRETLYALSFLDKEGLLKIPQLKSRVEHVQLFDSGDIHLFSDHNIIASMQPIHAISDMGMAETYWGERCINSYAWNSISQSGAQLIFGSDAPVESPNPFLGLHAAVLRMKFGISSDQNTGWIPKQYVGLQTALNAYTSIPSQLGGFNNLVGKVKTGLSADLVLLSKDFFSNSQDSIQYSKPLATMSGGKWVYKNDNIDIDIN